ncbi:hypothetical protein PRIPAC_78126 [Pristionchus pacificus]|uniref:glucuronosyltransferase n=1 Tax=Pristionchus pacificus TaxID=54126 RepID=A0A2A6CQD9_PRIPA|nr:hypothetical protein PRIPAC_78126 [Pristionchus pacificus]|eukprot:PDM80316.1 Glycosyltransferase [Pristionchus pacificus]
MRLILHILVVVIVTEVASYKILVYNSKVGYSNVNFYGNIADILVEAGHDVTSLLLQIEPSLFDGTLKSKKIHSAKLLRSGEADLFEKRNLDAIGPFYYGTHFTERFVLQCRGTLEEQGLIDRLRTEQFDVMIAENYDMCGIGLSHIIKPKALINGAASVPIGFMFQEFGLPKSWSSNFSPRNSHIDVHSFFSRLKNLYSEAIVHRIWYSSRTLVEKVFKEKYGSEFPSLTTIINSEPLTDFATPTLSRVVYVGGLGAKEPMRLEKEFDDILSLRSKTVLISFGSIVAAYKLKIELKNSIVKTVKQFPAVTFIWKYETPDDEFSTQGRSVAPNLHLVKWVPQNDLLADRSLTAFITHSGGGSTQETAMRGKPGLFIPCFGDQPRNAAMMERAGLGKVFDKHDVSNSEKFTTAVRDLLENQTSLLNSASAALRPQSHDMNWIEYNNLDILALAFMLIIALVMVFSKILVFVFRRLWKSKTKTE